MTHAEPHIIRCLNTSHALSYCPFIVTLFTYSQIIPSHVLLKKLNTGSKYSCLSK